MKQTMRPTVCSMSGSELLSTPPRYKAMLSALSDSTKDKPSNRLISVTEAGKSIKDGLVEGLLKDGK